MKAANIYQQFDKKGNLFENRLYAKTSINQAKLTKEQTKYDKRMESHPDEMCRINNGSIVTDKEKTLMRTQRSMAEVSKRGSTSKLSGNQKSMSHSIINFTAGNAA